MHKMPKMHSASIGNLQKLMKIDEIIPKINKIGLNFYQNERK